MPVTPALLADLGCQFLPGSRVLRRIRGFRRLDIVGLSLDVGLSFGGLGCLFRSNLNFDLTHGGRFLFGRQFLECGLGLAPLVRRNFNHRLELRFLLRSLDLHGGLGKLRLFGHISFRSHLGFDVGFSFGVGLIGRTL